MKNEDVLAAINKALDDHVRTMHKDLHQQIRQVCGGLQSLSNDLNESVKALRNEQKEIRKDIAGLVEMWRGAGWLKRAVIDLAKVATALTAIGGSIWAFFHWGGHHK